jgi:3-oxoacyl-[acyl-carrier protein] reductase
LSEFSSEEVIPMRLKDRSAIVTGGSRGIGRAVVLALAAEGAKVAVFYKGNKEAAESLVTQVRESGQSAVAMQVDVSDAGQVQVAVERVEAEVGPVDILVNNAGVIHDDLFVRMEFDAWNAVLQTNLGGTFHCSKAVAFGMMKRRSGRIINMSSVAAEHGA